MKLFCKALLIPLLFLSTIGHLNARPIIYITHKSNVLLAQKIKSIIVKEQFVPEKFVTIEKLEHPCVSREKPLLWLCIDESGKITEMEKSPVVFTGRLAINKGKEK